MIAARSIWRENWKVWVPAAVVAAAAAGFLALYLTSYADRVGVLRTRLGEERARLAGLRADHSRLEAARQRLGVNQSRVRELYDLRLSTERERFTQVISEVRALANRAGLRPQAIRYPKTEVLEQGLVKKGIEFAVAGRYEDLRQFLNLIELSDRFVAVEEIGLKTDATRSGDLTIDLSLSAWFAGESTDPDRGVGPASVATSGEESAP